MVSSNSERLLEAFAIHENSQKCSFFDLYPSTTQSTARVHLLLVHPSFELHLQLIRLPRVSWLRRYRPLSIAELRTIRQLYSGGNCGG